MGYATVSDVATLYGPIPLGDEQYVQVVELLEWAEDEVKQRVPDLAARIEAGRTSDSLVRRVLAEMVTQFLRNPEGYVSSSMSRTIGSVVDARSGTYGSGRSGQLELTRRHLRLLGQRVGGVTLPNADPALPAVVHAPSSVFGAPAFGNVHPDMP